MDEQNITRRIAFETMTGKPFPKNDSEIERCLSCCANYEGPVEYREKYCCAGKKFQGWVEIAKCSVKGSVHPRDCRLGACLNQR
jgi:hypothetical protein